jgi:hypothetical protein
MIYDATPEEIRVLPIVEDRVRWLLYEWSRLSYSDWNLGVLLRSCYLQGARDMAIATGSKRRARPVKG